MQVNFSVCCLLLIVCVAQSYSNPVPDGSRTDLLLAEEKIPIVVEASDESSHIENVAREPRHLHRRKHYGHYGGGGGGGSFASAGAAAGSFGGGHGGSHSAAQSHAASFSVGPFSASIASSFANSGSKGGGFFDY